LGSYYWFTKRPDQAKTIIEEYRELIEPQESLVLKANLHWRLPDPSDEAAQILWSRLEGHPGLPLEKVAVLLTLEDDEVAHLQLIEDLIREEEDPATSTRLLLEVFYHFRWEDDPRALEYGKRALEGARLLPYDITAFLGGKEAPVPAVTHILNEYAEAHRQAGEHNLSLEATYEALEYLTTTSNLWTPDQVLVNKPYLLWALAQDLRRLGEYDRALEAFNEALELLEKAGEWHLRKLISHGISEVYADLGEFDSAEDSLLQALQVPDRVFNPSPVLLAKLNLDFGRYEEALRWLERAKQKLDEARGGRFWARLRLELLAKLWIRLGDFEKALRFAKEAGETGRPYSAVGEVMIAMGSLEAAEAHYLARLKGIEGKNRKGLELDALKNLGRIYRIQGRLETAEATLETARGSLTVRADEEVLIELGLCRFEMGRHTEAVDTFEEALRIAETAVELPGVWTARYYLGQIAEQQRNRTLAISHYRGAVEAVESVATNLSVDFYKASFLENKTQTYDALIRLLGPTQPKEAFLFAERRRAQSYLDSLRRKGLKFKPTGRLAVEKSRAERLVIGKQSALREQYSKPQQQRNKDLISRLELELAAARTEHLEAFRMAQMERSSEAYREGVLAPLPDSTCFQLAVWSLRKISRIFSGPSGS
jgi:tetratricopeptide (TPR) repeat protein